MTHQYLKTDVSPDIIALWNTKVLPNLGWIPDETQRYNWIPSEESKVPPHLVRNLVIDLVHKTYGINSDSIGEILIWDGSEDLDWHADGDGDDECKDKNVVIAYLDVSAKNPDDIGTISIGERNGDSVLEIETIIPYNGLSLLLPTTGNLVHKVSKTNVLAKRVTLLVGIKT